MTSRPKTTPAPAAEPSSKHPAGAGVDCLAQARAHRDALASALLDPSGATATRTLAEIDAALASADSALALLAFEVNRQRDVAARREAKAAHEAHEKRKAALEAHAAKLLRARARGTADALASEADRLINERTT
jgi:hypothetical protein